jgi:energy-coupling factor transporter ATP-binding protein EcfA2
MRISKVSIRNYRCIESLDLEVDDYTALIGPNGAGKSSVLYALDWFFNGGSIGTEDAHGGALTAGSQTTSDETEETDGAGDPPIDRREVSVEVTFEGLTAADQKELGRYGRGTSALFRRTWVAATGQVKIVGNARQGPGFAAVRGAGSAPNTLAAYKELRDEQPSLGLPDQKAKSRILEVLDTWEADSSNEPLLEPIENSDATHMFGVQGENRLERRVRYVLIPAASDIASEVGGSSRGSTLSRLVGGLVTTAVAKAREQWTTTNQSVLDELTASISAGVSTATGDHTVRVNERLSALLPAASISIEPEMPDWTPKIDPGLSTSVTLDGRTHDVSRQGHGVQRAVMIAMLQALVPAASPQDKTAVDDGGSTTPEGPGAATFVVAIEEPEIYQHPVRARHLARALFALSATDQHQVLMATHSPYFIRPEQFAGLRRIAIVEGRSTSTQTTAAKVGAASGASPVAVQNRLEKELPRTFSEGFFADAAALVEGDTDKILLETVSERLGMPLDAAGIAVLTVGGKGSARLAVELLEQLGTPTFVLLDGDFLGHTHCRHAPGSPEANQAHASHRAETEKALTWLEPRRSRTITGPSTMSFGADTSIADSFCVLHDDIEHELSHWPGYQAALRAEGSSLRTKNAGAYRAVAAAADISSIPAFFPALIKAMIDRRQS